MNDNKDDIVIGLEIHKTNFSYFFRIVFPIF